MILPTPLHNDVNPRLEEAFKDMLTFLQARIPGCYLLEAGTALGFWRNGGPIGHDKDVDFGIMAEYYTPELEQDLLQHTKFKSFRRHGRTYFGYEARFIHENGTRIDWFLFYEAIWKEERVRWAAAYLDGGSPNFTDMFAMPFPADMIELPDEYEYRDGLRLPLPSRTEEYLVMRYGPDWRIPTSKWDWRTPHCRDDEFTKFIIQSITP